MKLWLGKPRNHWISPYTILDKVFFWKELDHQTAWVVRWTDRLEPLSRGLQWFLDKVHPPVNVIVINKWDTWSMDYTLAPVIHKLLVQLKATKHGSPFVDDADVPEAYRSTNAPKPENDWDVDDYHHYRWDWVLREMIWAFEQLSKSDHDAQFYKPAANTANTDVFLQHMEIDRKGLEEHTARIDRALMLFGKYYRALWD